ncbi:DUF4148 domain-containing protein [Caballeronia sp. LjRoot31]|uniref:DUF4148 domain-containing protein n=1 Tax=Caballeronia sp. LjRoot31 TaxID=3342324 RepID=UPI003ECE62CC
MKILCQAFFVAAVLAAPVAAVAQQSNAPVTRAQVRAELVQLEKAGYNPAKRDNAYPADIQAAEARVAARNDAGQAATTGVGGVAGGTAQSGHHSASANWEPLYGHH